MTLSSSVLVHNTDKKEYLKGILNDGFKVFYCKETLVDEKKGIVFHVPMISFSDIPLSEIKDQLGKYGTYGIGLTKEWAYKNKLNPVLYVAEGSQLFTSYRKAMRHFIDYEVESYSEKEMDLVDVIRYMKMYEGALVRKGKVIDSNYRFSDEREWRFVPPHDLGFEPVVSEAYFAKHCDAIVDAVKEIRLKIEPNDIKYILIDNEIEITEFIACLRVAFGKFPADDVDKLLTRFLTKDQIIYDF